MSTTQPELKQLKVLEQHECETWDVLIGEQVLHALGEPDGLFKVSVRPLWENRYRVNVYVGPDAVSSKIAHSYFLEVGGEGSILTATPTITRRY
jgi:hypothetical protein